MREDSVKSLLLHHLEGKGWCWGGSLELLVREAAGTKASCASRRLRELWNEGRVERRLTQVEGKGPWVVQYRERQPVRWEVITERESGKEIARVPIYS